MKKNKFLIFALLLILPLTLSAAVFTQGKADYTLRQGEVVSDNLYVCSGSVNILGEVEGDIISCGGSVLINGNISNDVLVGGGYVQILGNVGDDIRAGGGNIFIGGSVGGDVAATGGNVHILSSAVVEGDILVGSGKLTVDGIVKGKVIAGSGEIEINGTVENGIKVKTSSLLFGDKAQVSEGVEYTAPKEATISEKAVILGETVFIKSKAFSKFDKAKTKKASLFFIPALIGSFMLLRLLMLLIVGALAVLLFKKFSEKVGERALVNIWQEIIRGFVVLIVVPFAMIFMAISILGISAALIIGLVYALLLAISKIYAGVIFGGLIAKWVKKKVIINWKWTVVGIIALKIVCLIPFFGWIIAFALYLTAIGTVSYLAYQSLWLDRK